MGSATPVTDHDEIREWVESRGGRPACVKGTAALLRIDFAETDEKLQQIDWISGSIPSSRATSRR